MQLSRQRGGRLTTRREIPLQALHASSHVHSFCSHNKSIDLYTCRFKWPLVIGSIVSGRTVTGYQSIAKYKKVQSSIFSPHLYNLYFLYSFIYIHICINNNPPPPPHHIHLPRHSLVYTIPLSLNRVQIVSTITITYSNTQSKESRSRVQHYTYQPTIVHVTGAVKPRPTWPPSKHPPPPSWHVTTQSISNTHSPFKKGIEVNKTCPSSLTTSCSSVQQAQSEHLNTVKYRVLCRNNQRTQHPYSELDFVAIQFLAGMISF